MKRISALLFVLFLFSVFVFVPSSVHAALSLTSGNNATTTPNVATAITGFQIVGPSASTTPVQLRSTSGTLSMSVTTGLTFDGASSGSTVNFSGTVSNINAALATLTYTRASTGSDTLEVSLVNKGEIFFTDNSHLYQFISGSYSWNAAKTAAEALTAYGAAGYLATITSSAENTFVKDRLNGDGWIGASDAAVEGTWKWITGPEAGTTFWLGTGGGSAQGGNYAAWTSGEPNQSGDEDCAETYVSSGLWNDLPCGALLGYVVEYGTPGTLPTVVAKNISITTADVPAITSLSPANGGTNISPSANLVIGFSKTVTKQTGNILIRKSSDDSIVESIDVSGSQLTGSGTNTITIDPTSVLGESTQYYVTIPGTAFKDGSNNFFDGISATSTWVFTTGDVTAPVNSSITTSSTGNTGTTVTWTTNELGTSKVVYSADTSYASTTATTDVSPKVTAHSVTLSNLIACTTYNYRVVSGDASGNIATSTANTFVTTGCAGNTTPSSATSTPVTVSAGGSTTLSQGNAGITVTLPSNVTSTSSSLVIQVQALSGTDVLSSLGTPNSSQNKVGDIVFDVKAIINASTVLDSFNTPVTITYTYADSDIVGLSESSLWLYHYHGGTWSALDSCTVNESTNTISCTTPSFSIFSLFGRTQTNFVGSGKRMMGCKDPAAINYNYFSQHDSSLCKYGTQTQKITSSVGTTTAFTRDLKLGMTGDDVRLLQQFLNSNGFPLAESGIGSKGQESTYFGRMTRDALIKFQKSKSVTPSVGYFGSITRAHVQQYK